MSTLLRYPDRATAKARSEAWAAYLGCGQDPADVTRYWFSVEGSSIEVPDGDPGGRNHRLSQLIRENQMDVDELRALVEVYPAWETDTNYAVGDLRTHRGGLYRCVWAHTSRPEWAPSLASIWAHTVPADVGPEWVPLADDGTDQTGTWLAWLAEFEDGTAESPATIRLPSGRYRFDGTMRIGERSHLRIVGPSIGTPFQIYSDFHGDELGIPFRMHTQIARSTNVRVSFVHVRGPNGERQADNPEYALFRPDLHTEHAFAIRSGSVDCAYEDCAFTEVYGDGINVGSHNEGVENANAEIKRVTGTYCGRQALGITHVVGLLVEDVNIQWAGRSGLDVEPNHKLEKVWDATFRRLAISSNFNPFALTGASNGALPQRRNLRLEDCTVIACGSSHPALLASRSPTEGFLEVIGHTDLRNSSRLGLNIGGYWETVTVEGCRIVFRGKATPTTYFIQARCTGTLTVRNNIAHGTVANGEQEGFDELVLFMPDVDTGEPVVPAEYNHCGNVWAMGTQNDRECP